MKLRVCSVRCNRNIKVQINSSVKTLKSTSQPLRLIELGTILSYGRDHWVGISTDQVNREKVQNHISNLEEYPVEARIKWFENSFPHADIYRIESSKIGDWVSATKNTIDRFNCDIYIDSSFELKWKGING